MLRVLNDNILIRPDDVLGKTKGGIILPDAAKQEPPCATVVAVGPGLQMQDGSRLPLSVMVGDRVLIDGRLVRRFDDGDETYVICTEAAIIGVKEPKGN